MQIFSRFLERNPRHELAKVAKMEELSSGHCSSQDDSKSRCPIAESIYVQGIKRVLSVKELLLDTARTLRSQQNLLEEVKVKIEKQQKHELYLKEKEVHLPYSFKTEDSRSWIKDVFMEEEMTSDEDSDREVTEEDYRDMMKQYKRQKKCRDKLKVNPSLSRFMYYSSDFISGDNKWPNHRKGYRVATRKRKLKQEVRMKSETDVITPFPSAGLENLKRDGNESDSVQDQQSLLQTAQFCSLNSRTATNTGATPSHPVKKKKTISVETLRKRLWKFIAKKEIPKAFRIRCQIRGNNLALVKRVSRECMKKQRVLTSASMKISKDKAGRARRITREMQMFWKKYSKVEKVHRKKAEKHALERIKMDEELREAKRQQRKLNFLISQTELFAHFISKKLSKQQDGTDIDERIKSILTDLETSYESDSNNIGGDQFPDDDMEGNGSYYTEKAMTNVKQAMEVQRRQTESFDTNKSDPGVSCTHDPLNPNINPHEEVKQPSLFNGSLKSYQIKGMNWLVNLYEQGINGILADEMGLGKTVQTIAFLGHLAEKIGIWGPFLVVAPASTLNNWHQEFTRFFPSFKVLPYWGNAAGRKVLRKFWNQKASHHSSKESAPFHVLVTSYQLVISDVRYFQRIKWQYMILDEAQALKSSSSIRWKILLDFNCRNRLLLTGTPIQNTMAELWALLHFIMPSLFDSHNEFNEWFSKDIENHIENKSNIDEKQLSRLHMILKPFMLRRIKLDVENELSEKIEIRVHCSLTPRQKILYNAIQQNIKLEDLLRLTGATSVSSNNSTTLMNLVMQFRKVCNHPDLFERREVLSSYSAEPLPTYLLPRLLYREGILSRINHFKKKLLYCDLSVHHPSSISSTDDDLNHVSTSYSLLRALNLDFREFWEEVRSNPLCWINLNEKIRSTIISLYFRYIFSNNFAQRYNEAPDVVCSPHKQTGISTKTICHKTKMNLSDFLIVPINFYFMFSPGCVFQNFLFTQNCENFYTHHITLTCLQNRHGDPYHPNQGTAQNQLVPVSLPACFLTMFLPPANAKICEFYCCDRSACNEMYSNKMDLVPRYLSNSNVSLLRSVDVSACSLLRLPDRECLVRDSGKLYALDILLRRLKREGHRVLIYSQMTRMIDLLEEYMWYRCHTYMRLDGSSKISERRDMVADFQSRSDIFAFLLSTRAGGLGINLTAADTVIFYDSDWNPTVDQQAMDRAHRLGQTKQVTVYRLVCQGTVDERILQRAEEKSVIQRMVIAGGNFHPDTLKAKEVVSLLLDDEQLAQRLKMKKEENKMEGGYKGKKRGRKTNAEREAKRIKELQDQGITEEHVTIIHSASSTPPSVGRSSLEDKMKSSKTSSIDLDFDSLFYFDSAPASPVSEVSVNSDLKNLEDDLIVVDDVTSVPSPSGRGKGVKRARGRPRIRPIMPEVPKRTYNRSSANRGRPRGRGLRRGRKIITGRAAAMAGARAGAAAASAAAYAAYGYGMEPSNLPALNKDKTVSNLNSNS